MSTGSDTPDPFELQTMFYYQYGVAVYSNLFTGIVYGAYIVVYVISTYVILSKPGFTSSLPRMSMFGITTFMFALGVIALVLEITIEFLMAKTGFYIPFSTKFYFICSYVRGTVTCLMYVLCDAICAWRTIVLWNNDKRVIAILVFFILGTTGACGCAVAFNIIQGASPGERSLLLGELDLIVVAPTLVTNLISTGLITWKAWQRRTAFGKHLRQGNGSVRVDRVFALLIESGLVYCCIWILYWISKSTKLPDPGFTTIAFVSGLYPTLIIILISKQMSPVEHYSVHSTEMQFTRVPALVPPSLPQHVLTLRRGSTSDSFTPSFTPSDEQRSLLQ